MKHFYVLKDAIERAGSTETDALIVALEKTNLPAVRGTIRFDESHQIIYGYDPKTSVLGNWIQWQDGKRITIFPQAASMGSIKMPPWFEKVANPQRSMINRQLAMINEK